MDKSKCMKKGDHEKSMEKAKKLIDKGIGLIEIAEETNLSKEDIIKAKKKWVDQS